MIAEHQIRIDAQMKAFLAMNRQYPRETNNDILRRLLGLTNGSKGSAVEAATDAGKGSH